MAGRGMGGAHGRRAAVIGTGLIGASIGLALREQGWHVTGRDASAEAEEAARAVGALDAVGDDPNAELTFVATPVAAVATEVERALEAGDGVVTDVASVKAPMSALMDNPRYVGGHPMAGSEQEGAPGARADLFKGAAWVLTPVPGTDDDAFATVRDVVASFGAEVVALLPGDHDQMVAVVSHVPHLTAATLMTLANERSSEHRALLRLAAGGFRDMTRIASGSPAIWPDICATNREAILAELDALIASLGSVREVVAAGDRERLVGLLDAARSARRSLPLGVAGRDDLVEVRLPIADEAGALATVLLRAAEAGVSVADVEIAHSAEGGSGVLVLVVAASDGRRLADVLAEAGERPNVVPL